MILEFQICMLKICMMWNEGKFEKWVGCACIETESINSIELG